MVGMVERFKRKLMESDGLYLSDSSHGEMFEGSVYIDYYKRIDPRQFSVTLHIPIDIARHLNLKNKQRVTIAIKHNEGKGAV